MTFLFVLEKAKDLQFLTDFFKNHNAELILSLSERFKGTIEYGRVTRVLANILDSFENNPEELKNIVGLEYMRNNYFGENISIIKYILKQILLDDEFVESLSETELKLIFKSNSTLTLSNSEDFMNFYRNLENNFDIGQVVYYFGENIPVIKYFFKKIESEK
jgi:hypothetical protein